jgi:predicted RNase H-like HicB family nuclease
MMVDDSTLFNETSLRAAIVGVWGEHGAHVGVFDGLLAEMERWRKRDHATVYERTAWHHDIGQHDGAEHPFAFCPRCEIDHPKGRLAVALQPARPSPDPNRLTVTVERDGLDGGFITQCVEVPGAISQGDTLDEALANIADAIHGVDPELWPAHPPVEPARPSPTDRSTADPHQFIGLMTPSPGPTPMTGVRNPEAQDQELTEIYGIDQDEELPGMWERADFEGGDPDERPNDD